MRALTQAIVALLAITALTPTLHAQAQRAPADEELTISPYHLLNGTLDIVERRDRYLRLAALAESAGDYARAARHFSLACGAGSGLNNGAALAASSCQRAKKLAHDYHLVDVEVGLLSADATVRAWTLDVPGAIRGVQDALAAGAALNPDLPDSAPINGAHYLLGAIMIEAGKVDVALKALAFSRDHCGIAGNSVCAAYSEMWLCRLHTQLGNFAPARTACDAAQAHAVKAGDALVDMSLGWMRANLEEALGRHEASLASLQGAWRAAQIRGGESLRPTLMQLIADRLVTLGRLDDAEVWQAQLEHALSAGLFPPSYAPQTALRRGQIAMARGRRTEAVAAFETASRSPQHELSIGAQYALATASREQNDLPGARLALERAIAQIETGRTNLSGAALRAGYLTLHAKAYSDLIGVRWDSEGVAAGAPALEIAEAGRARALLDALMSAQVVGAAAPTLSAAAVQATLGANEVLVEYVSSEDRLLALTVTRDRIAFTTLPAAGTGTASALARRIDFFSALVQQSDEATLGPTARRLYDDLLAPALTGVPASARTLIIAADGPLHRLPFDALGEPRVIDRWDVVTLPSASALANRVRRATPTAAALVVTAPSDLSELGDLPAAPAEAAAIRRRLGGEIAELSGAGATRAALERSGLSRFAVLHFASHALVDEARPLRSALVLTPGAPGAEGRWTAEDIYRANLGADLVVLSACSTAAGAQTPGEGVMSLARAFLYAGAGATIATLWDVPDAPGPIFADVLYRELAAGRPLGAAAAEARRELRHRGAPPRAWASYVVTGNPRSKVGVTGRTDRRLLSAGVAGGLSIVLLLGAAVIFVARMGWTIRWQAPAVAGAGLAIAAMVLQKPIGRDDRIDLVSHGDRGAPRMALVTATEHDRFTWSALPGADESIVEIYDAAGRAIGAPVSATSPFIPPPIAEGGWIRIEARHSGLTLARSNLIRLPASQAASSH